MTESQIKEITNRFHFNVYNRLPVTLVKGRGSKVWDMNGTEYLDALAGIAVNNLGHCHPKVVSAIKSQAEKLMHISNFFYSEPQAELLELLNELSNMDRIFLCNSGAEAVEGAVKLARKYGEKHNKKGTIITVSNAFHGRTIGTVSMGMNKLQKGFQPLLPGFKQIPFNDVHTLKNVFDDDAVGLILEPIQGSGGLHVVSSEFIHTARNLCNEYGAVFILDEVQTGLGRTGRFLACEHYGVEPDIIALAKGLGSGFPIGAVLAREQVAASMTPGDHGSTFGGNPLACAAAVATLQVLRDEQLSSQAAEKGAYLMEKLIEKLRDVKQVNDIRGKGLMIGIELSFNGNDVVKEMMRRGVLSNCISGNVLRIVPPLIINYEELDRITSVITKSIKEIISVKEGA